MVDHNDLMQRLLVTFQGEAEDHLKALFTLLIDLEREPEPGEQKRLVETLFRRMHTLKGAAHAVNLLDVAELCQALESLLSDLKRGEIAMDPPLLDQLHREVNALEGRIFPGCQVPAARPEKTPAPERKPPPKPAPAASELPQPADPPPARPAQAAPEKGGETVRVPVQLLESLLLKAEELSAVKLGAAELVQGVGSLAARVAAMAQRLNESSALARGVLRRGAAGELGQLAHRVQEQQRFLDEIQVALKGQVALGERSVWELSSQVELLLEQMRELQLLPFSTLLDPLPKLIRDLGQDLGKQAELGFSGAAIEIDRRILAELKEPLLHLVRNLLDHGIEPPEERQRAGKPVKGRVTVALKLLDGNRAELLVADDGRGIDLALIKGRAIALEIVTAEQAAQLSEADALGLIFESGLSTSPLITSISGRGLGLPIVRDSLERLGGHVTVTSEPGRGTAFHLVLPLSFAMMRALLVEVSGRLCLIPAANLGATVRVPAAEIRCVENRETVLHDGRLVALARLGRILELPEPEREPDWRQLALLSLGEREIAFAVDQVLGVQEVLVKPLGPQLSRVRNVAGAAALGDGTAVPVLNVNDLFRSALTQGAVRAPAPERGMGRPATILVAEDSITSRTLLKNILEGAGFRVVTAVDGADALATLKSEEIDLVLSDVEMPRLDGFGLTEAIRKDQRLARLPVLLVTGLESREDRERGIDVGADAYIVKSSFDQGGLVDVIRKLI